MTKTLAQYCYIINVPETLLYKVKTNNSAAQPVFFGLRLR